MTGELLDYQTVPILISGNFLLLLLYLGWQLIRIFHLDIFFSYWFWGIRPLSRLLTISCF